MGIPYYFASILRAHKHAIQACRTKQECDVLAIDFNCLIHRYLDEANPVSSIVDAIRKLYDDVCLPKILYVGADGLAPYAKIVQQRYRRFRKAPEQGVFDRNQISPGTLYMKELMEAVRQRFPTAFVSGTDQPGEGEHKLFAWLKTLHPEQRRSVMVYGLDADLILLSLAQKELTYPHSMWLLREAAEFKDSAPVLEGFCTMSVWGLAGVLPLPIDQFLRMSILCFGNDFMPNIGMFSLREDGYSRALHLMKKAGYPNLGTAGGMKLFLEAALEQELQVLKGRVANRDVPFERSIISEDATHIEERMAVHLFDGERNFGKIVSAYWRTYTWTLQYFLTNSIRDWNWVYPYSEAPTVSMMLRYPIEFPAESVPCSYTIETQLRCILPNTSLERAGITPVYPDEWYNEEEDTRIPWMRRHRWETDPLISIPWNPTGKLTKTTIWTPAEPGVSEVMRSQ